MTDLYPAERERTIPDPAGYEFLILSIENAGRMSDGEKYRQVCRIDQHRPWILPIESAHGLER